MDRTVGEIPSEYQIVPLFNDGRTWRSVLLQRYATLGCSLANALTSEHPIDLTRYQVVNNYMGRAGLINSGGASGDNDFAEAVKTAVINKRAGGIGLISGRKAFQRPMTEGAKLLNAIQDVYLEKGVTIA